MRAQMGACPESVCGRPVWWRCFSRSAVAPVRDEPRDGSAGDGNDAGEKDGEGLVEDEVESGGGGHSWPKSVNSAREISAHVSSQVNETEKPRKTGRMSAPSTSSSTDSNSRAHWPTKCGPSASPVTSSPRHSRLLRWFGVRNEARYRHASATVCGGYDNGASVRCTSIAIRCARNVNCFEAALVKDIRSDLTREKARRETHRRGPG